MMRTKISNEQKVSFEKIGLPIWQKPYPKNRNTFSLARSVKNLGFRDKPTDFSEFPGKSLQKTLQ